MQKNEVFDVWFKVLFQLNMIRIKYCKNPKNRFFAYIDRIEWQFGKEFAVGDNYLNLIVTENADWIVMKIAI
jgi:hypothetical protein